MRMLGHQSCKSPTALTQGGAFLSPCPCPSKELTAELLPLQPHFRFCVTITSPGSLALGPRGPHNKGFDSGCSVAEQDPGPMLEPLGAAAVWPQVLVGTGRMGEEGAAPAISLLGASRFLGGFCHIRG